MSTCSNFAQIYDQIREKLVDVGLATEREVPAWMDIDGNIVLETSAFGCKVTHDIDHPDWILIMDELGGNTNQLQMCESGKKITKKNKCEGRILHRPWIHHNIW